MGGSSGSLYANWLLTSRTPTHRRAPFSLRRPISGTTRALTAIVSSRIRILLSAVLRFVCHVYVHIYVCMHNRYIYMIDTCVHVYVCTMRVDTYMHTYLRTCIHTGAVVVKRALRMYACK